MMISRVFTIFILISGFFISYLFGQSHKAGTMIDGHTLKGHLAINPYEAGAGMSYQYYLGRRVGLQLNLDGLIPVAERWTDDDVTRGIGVRFNPEFRYYPNRRRSNGGNSFFIGGGPVLKQLQMHERRWSSRFDNTFAESYSRWSAITYNNTSVGVMARLGMEAYLGKAKRTVFEFSYGFGLTQNWVRKRGDLDAARDRWLFDEISVSNRNGGVFPYIDFRLAFGRRFFKDE